MRYSPPVNKLQISVVIILLTALSIASAVFSALTESYASSALQALFFVILTLELLLVARFLTARHTYVIDDFEFFIIKERFGEQTVVCRIPYDCVVDIKQRKEGKNAAKDCPRCNYCQSMFVRNGCYVFFELGNGDECVLIEPVPYFAKALEKRVKNDIILN